MPNKKNILNNKSTREMILKYTHRTQLGSETVEHLDLIIKKFLYAIIQHDNYVATDKKTLKGKHIDEALASVSQKYSVKDFTKRKEISGPEENSKDDETKLPDMDKEEVEVSIGTLELNLNISDKIIEELNKHKNE